MALNKLEELLKKKGVGPKGSKSLTAEEVSEVATLLIDEHQNLTTRATMLVALLILPPNEFEIGLVKSIQQTPEKHLPNELIYFIKDNDDRFYSLIRKLLNRIDLNETECIECMNFLFDKHTPEFLKGAFLEGERLKRETSIENLAFLDELWKRSQRIQTDLPLIIDIGDSYDGCNRTKTFTPFVGALLASVGIPTLIHGIHKVAPKNGITTRNILEACHKNALKSMQQAVEDLRNIGWAYLDVEVYFPELFQLTQLRKNMVKRPFLATFEKVLQPIRAKEGNHIVTGYVHPHYKTELIHVLNEHNKSPEVLIVKGVEGSTQLAMHRDSVFVHLNKTIQEGEYNPSQFGLENLPIERITDIDESISIKEGLDALNGVKNYARENMLYLANIIINTFKLNVTKEDLITALNNGNALKKWEMY